MKTYKREVALSAMVILYLFCGMAVAGYAQALEIVKILVVPTFLAVGGAFGLDAVSKQGR